MNFSLLLISIALLSVYGAAAFAVGMRFARGAEGALSAHRREAVDAAVASILNEREAAMTSMAIEREGAVAAAVDSVVKVAGSALEAKLNQGHSMLGSQAQAFEQRAQDMNGELARLNAMVAELQKDRALQHGELVNRLEQTAVAANSLQATTQGLHDALASPKSRGQWGERMAEDVLRVAGFIEGVNYCQQATNASGTRPDFTFFLPHGLELNMDVKFPIDNYLRYLKADNERDGAAASAAFLRDVRSRVKEITTRDYIDPARTVDQVLLFIPNESIYSFIHENDAQLLDWGLAQKVVVCSPSTLFAVLAVVRHATRNFMFERTSDEILDCLTRFVKQWEKFAAGVDRVGRGVNTLSNAFDELNGTRRRQMERELERVEELRSTRMANPDGDVDVDVVHYGDLDGADPVDARVERDPANPLRKGVGSVRELRAG